MLLVSGLFILECPFGFLYSLFCVLCIWCCRCLDCPYLIANSIFSNLCYVYCVPSVVGVCIVPSWTPLQISLTFVLCIVYPVLSVSGLSIFPLRFSLTFVLCIVYPVLSVTGLFILECQFGFLQPLLCVLCTQCCRCLYCSFLIAPSVFANLCSVYCIPSVVGFCIVHTWLPLRFSLTPCYVYCVPSVFGVWIVHSWLPLQFSLNFVLYDVYPVLSISGLFIFDCPFGFL
jgi:hypothetical protein